MEYHLELGPWGQIFPVPCALVDRHLKLAGREQLQVLLWALRHAGEGFSSHSLIKIWNAKRFPDCLPAAKC